MLVSPRAGAKVSKELEEHVQRLEARDHDSFKEPEVMLQLPELKVGVGQPEMRLQDQLGPVHGVSYKPC